MMNTLESLKSALYSFAVEYIDIDYSLWLTWLLMPLLITILLPVVVAVLLYLTALILYIYKLHGRALQRTIGTRDYWATALKIIAAIWDGHGWIWHGYEVNGLENIPTDSPALLIYYHGSIPIDAYYLVAKIYLCHNRLARTVVAKFLFKVPGYQIIADACKLIPGTIQTCTTILNENNLLAIAPGGIYEAQFSSSTHYNILWKRRVGFAKVAIDAKCPIIPIFTENIKEAFRNALFGSLGTRMFLKLYSWTKFPFSWVYGGFPVKLVTHVGKPIPYDPSLTAEELQVKILHSVNALIAEHQRLPGSITHALLDRIPYLRRKRKERHQRQLKKC